MNAEDISEFARENGIRCEVVRLGRHAPTVDAAAEALGVSCDSIVKSVVILADSAPVLVIASGTTRIDTKRLADYLGVSKRRVRLADARTVLELTGFDVGAVPPFGHPARLRTLMEDRVLAEGEVYAGGGAVDAVVRIAPAEIVRATEAEIICLV